ncbi:MAG: hypothetical protein ACOX1F_00935 [Erysipelotrichaceae bacterium]|jgi:hypothetical protein
MKKKFVDSLFKKNKPELTIKQKGKYIYHCYVCPECKSEVNMQETKCKNCKIKLDWSE